MRNYNTVGFVFNANITSSNLANLAFFLVKASIAASGAKPQVVYSNSVFWYNDWETTTPAYDQINIPIPAGTNFAFCWRTNFDVSGGDYTGIYQETNNISFGSAGQAIGWASNVVVGVNKKIIPFSLSGGNL